MKLALLLVLLLSFQFSVTATVDSIEVNDNTVLEIKNGKEIFQPQADWWDKYSSGLIAAFTVIVSLGISLHQAKQTQKRSKQNSIAEARIRWVNDLRPLLSELIVSASTLHGLINDLGKYHCNKSESARTNLTPVESKLMNKIVVDWAEEKPKFDSTLNQIRLFLNPKESDHESFLSSVSTFINNAKDELNGKKVSNRVSEKDVVIHAQVILKKAWEQAKNGGYKKNT